MMEQLKLLAYTLCVVTLSFAILKGLLPSGKFEKNLSFILSLVFVLLLINGIREIRFDKLISFPEFSLNGNDLTMETQLENAVIELINNHFLSNNTRAECLGAEVAKKEDRYLVVKIDISLNGADKDAVIKEISSLTGVDEELIYVTNE